MTRVLLSILLSFLLCLQTLAQSPDSITHHYDSISKVKLSQLDSSSNRFNNKVDSLQLRMNSILNGNLNLNGLRSVNVKPSTMTLQDSITATRDLESARRSLSHKIDSLKALNLPFQRYSHKLDSLNKIDPVSYFKSTKNRIGNIEERINSKLSLINKEGNTGLPGSVDLDGNLKLPADNSSVGLPALDLKTGNPIGDIKNPVSDELNKAGDLKNKLNDLKQVPQKELEELKSNELAKEVQTKAGDLNKSIDKTQGYQKDIKNLADGNLDDVKSLPAAVDKKVNSIDEIKELEKHKGMGELDKYKNIAGDMKTTDGVKQTVKKQVVGYSKNHFAGKEAALKSAMNQLADLKKKYPDMPTKEQMLKRVYNAMHGKPFIERIVPGIAFQVQRTNNFIVDINPSVSYRLSGVWNAGIGWNERLAFHKWNKLNSGERVYGPRAFTSVVIAKGFGVKIEGERMNTFVPPNGLSVDTGHRQWVWSWFVGIKKDYSISKKLRGNVQTLYNIYDDHNKSPYPERLVIRMGFEFPIKKTVKK